MKKLTNTWQIPLAICLLATLAITPVFGQNPTGTLTGRVVDADGGTMPGVLVTVESPRLQGQRSTTTSVNGDYKIAFLPPGLYQATYQLDGFSTATREVKLSAAQTAISDIQLQLSSVVEQIEVTGALETISVTQTAASTYTQDEIEKLAVNRDLRQASLLTPGVSSTGPGNNVTISGAMSFENLWLLNGVVINENLRGQALPLFIEDAIQETTTSVSGISAEYGRFTGGVVNAITKSGGNQFSGSIRTNLNNDDWESETPLSGERADDITQTYEGTLGGYLWRDHLWFFTAARDLNLTGTDTTQNLTGITYATSNEEQRLEGKLTLAANDKHSLIGSYLEIDQVRGGTSFGRILDLRSVNTQREDPQEIKTLNYTGVLSSNFFVEAQYSERDYVIGRGSGGVPDLIEGTLVRTRGTAFRYHSPTFCGSCEDENRNNDNLLGKASYFLSTDNGGSHDIVFGYDTFDDVRFAVNHQTGSDWTVYGSDFLIDGNNNIFPVIGSNTWLRWFYILNLDIAQPTSFKTNSFYVNDSWQLNDRLSFNIGARYDQNDGTDSAGALVTDDTKISPRLGMTWDVKGDGDMVMNLTYGTYVAGIANSRADSTSGGGAVSSFVWGYGGPGINQDASCLDRGDCVSTQDVLRQLFAWYEGEGGSLVSPFNIDPNAPINGAVLGVNIPGATSQILDTLKSPSADEITIGLTKRLGSKGSFRADLVFREWDDFYSNRATLATGTVDTAAGLRDLTEVGNFGNDVLNREYSGLHTQFRYRLTDRFTLAGNYTLSKLEGNIVGEAGNSGPVPASPNIYPEYQENRWAFPEGNLGADQRHRIRAWAVYDLIDTERNSLSVSLLQNFFSGTPYGANGAVDSRPFVTNPGYVSPSTSFGYWFTARDAFKTEDITRTDISVNYSFNLNAFGRTLEVFIQPEILNVFDEQGVDNVNTDVFDETNASGLATFNPFTDTPIEGVHWRKGDDFGQPTEEDDYQTPRTFRFSVGLRF